MKSISQELSGNFLNKMKGELKISPIGQGTGYDFDHQKIDVVKTTDLIREGVHSGMNFIDTAEGYGNGLAEKIVGKAIKKIREKVFVATKFSTQHSKYKEVIGACQASLKRLGSNYIDLYQIHWPNPKVPLEETLSSMIKLQKMGYVRKIGIGNFSTDRFKQAEKIVGSDNLFSIQTEYSIHERTIEQNGVFDFANNHHIYIIAYSPLDQGRINQMNNLQLRLMNKLSRKYQKSIAQIMLRWVVNGKKVIVIPRTSKRKHLVENAQVNNFLIDKNDMRRIDNIFRMRIVHIPVNKIHVSENGERNSLVYQTISEALENKLNFVPSPMELSEVVKKGGFLKPIRLIKKGDHYDLISGRIRYWAWVIAFGNKKPVPAVIRNYLSTNKDVGDII